MYRVKGMACMLGDCVTDRFAACLHELLTELMIRMFDCLQIYVLACWFSEWTAGRFDAWLNDYLVALLAGVLTEWMTCRFDD